MMATGTRDGTSHDRPCQRIDLLVNQFRCEPRVVVLAKVLRADGKEPGCCEQSSPLGVTVEWKQVAGNLFGQKTIIRNVRIDRVLRAMMAMTFFAAAYMAENVRGGLQAIPRGQYEAAEAVGLNAFQTMLLIVLPQALRAVIPAIVGQFISLFMDTTLAIIVGLVELLAIGKSILNSNVDWLLLDSEVYIFIAAVFWVFTYSMSYASRRLEVALGVGER